MKKDIEKLCVEYLVEYSCNKFEVVCDVNPIVI